MAQCVCPSWYNVTTVRRNTTSYRPFCLIQSTAQDGFSLYHKPLCPTRPSVIAFRCATLPSVIGPAPARDLLCTATLGIPAGEADSFVLNQPGHGQQLCIVAFKFVQHSKSWTALENRTHLHQFEHIRLRH
jgi:hypothetical protein